MRVMVIVKASESSEAGVINERIMTEMGQYNERLVKAGLMKAGEGLRPSSEAARVHFRGQDRQVTDGPFAETKELIAGFWLWEVASMQEAIDWVKQCPNPMLEDSDIDIRPLYESADFDPTGEVTAQEDGLREQMELQTGCVQPYLFFSGRCEEALAFYEQALAAQIQMKLRFNESPDAVPEGMLQAGFESKIMHASIKIGNMTIMASDGCNDSTKFDGFRLTLTLPSESACHRAFNALADGGQVDMPLGQTFWSACYGMITDRFGVGWMVMIQENRS